MNKQIEKNLKQMKRIYKALAKSALKSKAAKIVLSDLKSHFKKGDDWPLRYDHYYEQSKIQISEVFNTILEAQGFEIYYDQSNVTIMIKLSKKMYKKHKVIGVL